MRHRHTPAPWSTFTPARARPAARHRPSANEHREHPDIPEFFLRALNNSRHPLHTIEFIQERSMVKRSGISILVFVFIAACGSSLSAQEIRATASASRQTSRGDRSVASAPRLA